MFQHTGHSGMSLERWLSCLAASPHSYSDAAGANVMHSAVAGFADSHSSLLIFMNFYRLPGHESVHDAARNPRSLVPAICAVGLRREFLAGGWSS